MSRPRMLSLALLLVAARVTGAEAADPPKLVVLIAVDQMRADYVDWYGAHWKRGLRRLYDEGAWVRNAKFPYLNTVTCPGHATIGTGTYPRTHGMILNTWYDRDRKKIIECTDDPAAPLLSYAPARFSSGDSAKNLMAPSLGDEMQAQLTPRPRVAAFSSKARSAIGLAGHKPDVLLWYESSTWVTSSAFTAGPTPWVEKWVEANPISAAIEAPWDRLLPVAAYKFSDDGLGEKPSSPWGRTFPHPLKVGSSPAGRWASSPSVDEFLGRLGRAAVSEMKLGQGKSTDLLAISFSMTDIVGHSFGPRSHEVQDVLARLDATMAALLDGLDAQVGRDNYVLALSADHGVAVIPEQSKADGKDAGRVSTTALKRETNALLVAELGEGIHVAEVQGNDIYLAPGVPQALAAKPGAMKRVLAGIRAFPGIADAFEAAEIKDPAKAADPLRKAAALSHYPGRSGDLMISPKRDWVLGSTVAANHGTMYDYDQRVPLLFYGKGIKPGKYDREASPADIAPTLAALVGVKMPRAEGTAITEVLATTPKPRK